MDYLAKAASVTDPALARGYRELARKQDSATTVKAIVAKWGTSHKSSRDLDNLSVVLLADDGPLADVDVMKRRVVAPKVAVLLAECMSALLDEVATMLDR